LQLRHQPSQNIRLVAEFARIQLAAPLNSGEFSYTLIRITALPTPPELNHGSCHTPPDLESRLFRGVIRIRSAARQPQVLPAVLNHAHERKSSPSHGGVTRDANASQSANKSFFGFFQNPCHFVGSFCDWLGSPWLLETNHLTKRANDVAFQLEALVKRTQQVA
jgi:hypothetical protein